MKPQSWRSRALTRMTVLALPLALLAAPQALAAPPTTVSFSHTGAAQSWTVPAGVTEITIEAWGAASGDCRAGGYARRTLPVTSGQTLTVMVGAQGSPNGGSNAFNGGGQGGYASYASPAYFQPGGGGGTDVRQFGNLLNHRVIVAGGAGGGAYPARVTTCPAPTSPFGPVSMMGGEGGGLVGNDGGFPVAAGVLNSSGGGGTQLAGGRADSFGAGPGSLGQGGYGAGGDGGGGGGGGYYGGGGGAADTGGGGGSGYAPGGVLLTGKNLGHGRVKIHYSPGAGPVYPSSNNSACSGGAATRVDRITADDGFTEYSVDVHHTPTQVQVCSTMKSISTGQETWSQDVVVDNTWSVDNLQPVVTPPTVQDEAPDGEAPGSPCAPPGTGQGTGTENARAYTRSGKTSTGETVICVGFRSQSQSRHIRVIIP